MDGTWVTAVLTVLGVALGYLVRYVLARPDLVERFRLLMTLADIVVHAVEQIGAVYGWDGAKKKAEAIQRLIDVAQAHGLRVTEAEVDTLIEGAVAALKAAGEEIASKAPAKTVATGSSAATITGSGGAGV